MKILLWLKGLVGNNPKTSIAIGVFVAILVFLLSRPAHAAEIDLRMGSSFAGGGNGPVLGLNAIFPQGNFDLYAGTLLWGSTPSVPNNWSWEAGFRACKAHLCASLGASYLQRTDWVDGSHANFNLELMWRFDWHPVNGIAITH